MSFGEHDTSRGTARSSPVGPEPGVPLITWVIGAAALLVVLTAVALFLDPSPHESEKEANARLSPENQVGEGPAEPARVLAPKSPLDLTASFLDAKARAELWNPSAILSGIELVIEEGRPKGPVLFEFGEAMAQAIPGVPLSPKQYSLSYEGTKVKDEQSDTGDRRVGLPEPNCPLEIAFRKLTEAGVTAGGRVGVLYTHSLKHGKPVWLVTSEGGQATSLNADNCALLRR